MKYLLILSAFLPLSLQAAAPELNAWLYQHPEISGNIVWEFPEVFPELPPLAPNPRIASWIQGRIGTTANGSSGSGCQGNSCPQYIDFSPEPGKTMQWYYWPESYKSRLKTYYDQYYTWLENVRPHYEQYQAGGFGQRSARLEEIVGSNIDPDTGTLPQPLPFAATVMMDRYTHVLYEPSATFDLYLKTLAMQLALEIGNFLPWKLTDYRGQDLAVILDGRRLFRYFPAGSQPWPSGNQSVSREGYMSESATPAPPLVAMKFLLREGIIRTNRWDSLGQWLEWERGHLQHTFGSPQSLVGDCGKEYHEVFWGTKGGQPVASILHGTEMACPLVPVDGSGSPTFFPGTKHFTGGCGTTGALNHRVMRQMNLVSDWNHYGHGQSRFVVEQAPFQAMVNVLARELPPDPTIDAGITGLIRNLPLISRPGTSSNDGVRLPSDIRAIQVLGPGSGLANAYIDHNDNPYGMSGVPEIPVREALIDGPTYQRWFPETPAYLSPEQQTQFTNAHAKRVGLRPTQLQIARVPDYVLWYYCWKGDTGKPHGETETYARFSEKYSVEELESTGFWQRLEQKLAEAGGCENL